MKNPLVSVIMPVFNAEAYIKKAIESILSQTYKNLEIIIIDDTSTDNTLTIIKKQFLHIKNLKLLSHEKNQGQGAARNTGLDHATGDYIVFVDSDDWMEQHMIQKLLDVAIDKDADVVACGVRLVYPDGNIKPYHSYEFEVKGGVEALYLFTDYRIGSMPWDKLYKKELIDRNSIKFPPDIYHEDVPFAMEIAYYCNKFISISDELYNYYQSDNSTTRKKLLEKHIYSYVDVYKLMESFFYKIGLHQTLEGKQLKNELFESQTVWILPNIIKFYHETETNEREQILEKALERQFSTNYPFVKSCLDYLMLNYVEKEIILPTQEGYLLKIKNKISRRSYNSFLYKPLKKIYNLIKLIINTKQ